MSDTRKTVLFIVEGSTDSNALENIFKVIYRRDKKLDFKVTTGDITSRDEVDIGNVIDEVYSYVDEYIKDKKLKKSDIWQIVQLFDTDGTYIPDTYITRGSTEEFFYETNRISCKHPSRIKARNEHKKELMDFLLDQEYINDIPYEGYYMSCNLDHALYNLLNLTDEEKEEYADSFYEEFLGRERTFIDFLKMDVVNGVPDDYKKSWKYIRDGIHSLERHTNLHIYFERHPIPFLL
ncbi:MAG: hypothetical protein K6E27_12380 [Eubacterium sp.]|nr:hypothetical protein [Eubacterium sp.]